MNLYICTAFVVFLVFSCDSDKSKSGSSQSKSAETKDTDDPVDKTDVVDEPETTMDTTSPVLTSLTPPADTTFLVSQNIDFVAHFSEDVIVQGRPSFSLDVGDDSVSAIYNSGSGSDALVFRYTVTETDKNDHDGISLNTSITGEGDIKDVAGNKVTTNFTSPDLSGIKVSIPWAVHLGTTTMGASVNTDICNGVAVDSAGNSYCAGYTSSDFGETNGGDLDAFIMKFDLRYNSLGHAVRSDYNRRW
jgi:hypothetical protein